MSRSTHKPSPIQLSLLVALLTVALAGEARAQPCFVTRNGGDFSFRGAPYKFIGVNLRGLAFHTDSEIDTQLASARDMGVRVVRIFIAKNNLNTTQVGDRLGNFLNRVSIVAPNMKVLVSLTDFYGATYYADGSRLSVQGDDGYFVTLNGFNRLSPAWFKTGYTTNYRPFVTSLVTRFRSDDRIFAWELGNELSAENATDILNFAYTMGWTIRNTGAQQMVTTGFVGVWHAANGTISTTLLGQMYRGPWGSWSTSPFHFGSIHTYNNEQVPGNPFGYQRQDWDINWFMSNAFPYVVGEGGFTGATASCSGYPTFTGSTWDGVTIPSAQSDRSGAVSATINRYFDVKGADGYMQWGFLAGPDNGEGDGCSGLDSFWHTDWTSLRNTYSTKAANLPGGGTASCGGTCIATVASDRWKGEYFNNAELTGSPSMVRDDGASTLSFDWGSGGPGTCGLGVDNFSVRWTRTFNFSGGAWRFTTTTDDGVRLYVDGTLVIDRWVDQGPTQYTADVTLAAGNHTLVFAYYERGGGALAQLSWAPVAQMSSQRLDVRYPMASGLWITQCIPDLSGRYVWQTTSTGKDANSRWANFMWPETITSPCGPLNNGLYPLIFTSLPASTYLGTWVTQCLPAGRVQHVYRIDTNVNNNPAAVYLYDEPNAACP
jgi:hypothetical protein